MSQANSDAWYVRLPDSRVVRANSTRSVRHHIESGTIPRGSYARRFPSDHWTPLHRIDAFADLLADSRRENRERPPEPAEGNLQLQVVGVQGLVTELVQALDSTLLRRKLLAAAATGLLFGLLVLLQDVGIGRLDYPWSLAGALVLALIALLAGANCTVLLGQMTFIELSQLRPARWREAAQNLFRYVLRLLICYLIVIGGIGGVLYLANGLPSWLMGQTEPDWLAGNGGLLAAAAVVVQILLQVALLPVLGFSLLLGPIVVVEEASILRALGQWLGMLRTHLRRLFLYEALAAAVALVASLPFLVPVAFAALNVPLTGSPGLAARATLYLLLGLAATPALAYLTVANVFIYLNLRYESPPVR